MNVMNNIIGGARTPSVDENIAIRNDIVFNRNSVAFDFVALTFIAFRDVYW